jgi:hypothetical protein
MDSVVQLLFRGKLFLSDFVIDVSEEPCYIFCMLRDKELVQEFGEEITIKTDLEKRLLKRDDYGTLVELRQAIFNAVKNTNACQQAKTKGKV